MLKWWNRINFSFLMDADGGTGNGGAGTGDGGSGDGGAGNENHNEPKTYDEEYVKTLRTEAATRRNENKQLKEQLDKMPQEITGKVLKALGLEPDPNKNYEQQLTEANKKALEVEQKANDRLIRAEVKMQSLSLQIIDPDAAYALMDSSNVKVNEAGEVEGVKEALESLIKAKAYLVGKGSGTQVGSGSNPGAGDPVDPVSQAKKLAEERNKGEQEAAGGYDPWASK